MSKLKIVTNFSELMIRAKKVGNAKKHGTQKDIDDTQKSLDEYKKLCLMSDEMLLNMTRGNLL